MLSCIDRRVRAREKRQFWETAATSLKAIMALKGLWDLWLRCCQSPIPFQSILQSILHKIRRERGVAGLLVLSVVTSRVVGLGVLSLSLCRPRPLLWQCWKSVASVLFAQLNHAGLEFGPTFFRGCFSCEPHHPRHFCPMC